MDFVNFQEEFKKIAHENGMGNAIMASAVCHKARTTLEEIFPEGECNVKSFENGLLTISFPSSGALARFNMLKPDFESSLKKAFDENPVRDIKAMIS